MFRRLRRFARRLVIALFAALLLCEVGLRITLAVLPANAAPPPAPVFAFIDNMPQRFNEDGQLEYGPVSSTGYNIGPDHLRTTSDQPVHYRHTLWLFGSSSVWGVYSVDRETLASYLQRALPGYRVVNAGQIGATALVEYYWLTKQPIARGDIVVFLDGAIDIMQQHNIGMEKWKATIPGCYADWVLLAKLWCTTVTMQPVPPSLLDWQAFVRYWRGVDQSRRYATARGATFYHFMQPFREYGDLYAVLARGDTMLTVGDDEYADVFHYTNAGHERLAREIAARVAAF